MRAYLNCDQIVAVKTFHHLLFNEAEFMLTACESNSALIADCQAIHSSFHFDFTNFVELNLIFILKKIKQKKFYFCLNV